MDGALALVPFLLKLNLMSRNPVSTTPVGRIA
jgi:hypothetical protein